MPKYDMTGYHFAIFPTDEPKQFVVWRMTNMHNGYEDFVGSFAQCFEYLRSNALAPLPGDTVTVSDAADATWWEVLEIRNRSQALWVREAGTEYAGQLIDRSMVKKHKRRVL